MTQKEKELLLQDFCGRLPYDVKGRVYAETTKGEYDINGDMIFFDSPFDVTLDDINTSTEELHVVAIGNEDTFDFIEDQQNFGDPYVIDDFKPYLRPMESMTVEEGEKLEQIAIETLSDFMFDAEEDGGAIYHMNKWKTLSPAMFDYLNSIHIDYRGLIPMGLALEAPEGMYND